MIKDVLKRQTTIIAVAVIGICLCLMGVSYAVFFDVKADNKNQIVTSGSLTVQFEETKNSLITNGAVDGSVEEPKSDEEGATSDGYMFSVTNTGTLPMNYDIYLYDDPAADIVGDRLDHQYIKVLLDDNTPTNAKALSAFTCESKKPSDLGEKGSDEIQICKINTEALKVEAKGDENGNATKTHTIRIWISDSLEITEEKIVALKLAVLGEAA